MRSRKSTELNRRKKLGLGVAAVVAVALPVVIGALHAPAVQAQDAGDWQAAAGGKIAFDVASVKLSQGAFIPPTFPLNPGDGYKPTGGRFRADFPLWTYIQFAYKIWPTDDQTHETLARLPKWVTTDRYSIDARGPANATKDQMRLMVQSLLTERFQLRSHFATKEESVFVLRLASGGTGPKLRPHSEGPPCDAADVVGPADRIIRGDVAPNPQNFPTTCGSLAVIRKSGGALMVIGYRNATMSQVVASMAGFVGEGRPVIDQTGLKGRYDFTMEWAPETAAPPSSDTGAAASEPAGPTTRQALRDQLGLKLESGKAPVQILAIDRVERPTEN